MTRTNAQIAQDFLDGLIRATGHDQESFYSIIHKLALAPELANVRPSVYYPNEIGLENKIVVEADYIGPQELWKFRIRNSDKAAHRFFDELGEKADIQFAEARIPVHVHDEHGMFEGKSIVQYRANALAAKENPIEVQITQHYITKYDKAEAAKRFTPRIGN